MSWQDILKRELGKKLQAEILEHLKFYPKSTVTEIIRSLKKRNLKPRSLKLFLDSHPKVMSESSLGQPKSSGLSVKQMRYSLQE